MASGSQRQAALQRMPYELMALNVQHIDLEDIFDLALSCRDLEYLIRDDRFCRSILEVSTSTRFTRQE